MRSAWKLLEAAAGQEVRMTDIACEAGVSRQAVYLHFPTRVELLVATTRYIDEVKDADGRLARSRAATSGGARLDAFVEAWSNYIPEVYGVAKALIIMGERDDAAREAWGERMDHLREGWQAAVDALERDGRLSPMHSNAQATDLLWSLLSVPSWEHLTIGCGWSQRLYVEKMKTVARQMLVAAPAAG